MELRIRVVIFPTLLCLFQKIKWLRHVTRICKSCYKLLSHFEGHIVFILQQLKPVLEFVHDRNLSRNNVI